MPETVHCDSAGDLLRSLSDLCDSGNDIWIFRGQANADWRLTSTLERDKKLKPFEESERAMLELFRSKAHIYTDLFRGRSDLSRVHALSIMQHHGAPTRLLDFTYSPSVAAFFSVCDDRESPPEYASVWAVNASKVRWWSNHRYFKLVHPRTHEGDSEMADTSYLIESREADFTQDDVWDTLAAWVTPLL